jgi:hypothetical protein
MSFKQPGSSPALFDPDERGLLIQRFVKEAREILSSAAIDLPGSGKVIQGDARKLDDGLKPCDFLMTSPPYVNPRLNDWAPGSVTLPIGDELDEVCQKIKQDGGKNGPLLATYVTKYFHDMFPHFQAAYRHVKSGGTATYIIGNSTFYGHLVPAQQWYAVMLREIGFTDVQVSTIRKRNSNLALYEYEVSGIRP